MEQNLVAVERTRQYFDNPLEDLAYVKKTPSAGLYPAPSLGSLHDHLESAIVFDNVCLSYNHDEQAKDRSNALKNVTFCIKKGEKVAFCGR
jgi:ABC-type multidrug transport system fused ATPase/permease subunit